MSFVEKNDRRIAQTELRKFQSELDELRRSSSAYSEIDDYRRANGKYVELPFFLVDTDNYDFLQQGVRFWKWICDTLDKNPNCTLKELMLEKRLCAEGLYIVSTRELERIKTMFDSDSRDTHNDFLFHLYCIKDNRNVLNVFTAEYNDEIPFNEKDYEHEKTQEPPQEPPYEEEQPHGDIFTPIGADLKARDDLKTKYNIVDKASYKKAMMTYHPDRNPGKEKWATEMSQDISQLMHKAAYPWYT